MWLTCCVSASQVGGRRNVNVRLVARTWNHSALVACICLTERCSLRESLSHLIHQLQRQWRRRCDGHLVLLKHLLPLVLFVLLLRSLLYVSKSRFRQHSWTASPRFLFIFTTYIHTKSKEKHYRLILCRGKLRTAADNVRIGNRMNSNVLCWNHPKLKQTGWITEWHK